MENDRFSIIQFVDLPLNKGYLSISMLVYLPGGINIWVYMIAYG